MDVGRSTPLDVGRSTGEGCFVTWLVLALGTAAAYALHGAWSKRVSGRTGPLMGSWALFAFALPFLAVYLAVQGMPELGPRIGLVLAVNSVLNVGATYLFLSALRAGDLGVTFPLLVLTPLFVVPVEFVLLGELPGPWGAAGILLVVAGLYLLNFGERREGLAAPFRALVRNPGSRRALAVALIWSVTGTVDRVGVLESSPAFYGVGLAGGLTLLFSMILVGRWALGGRAPEPPRRPGWGPSAAMLVLLVVHGALFAGMFVLQMEALDRALASYVLTVKRTGAVLAVLIGWMAFRERAVGSRLTGTAVTVGGIAILAIWG